MKRFILGTVFTALLIIVAPALKAAEPLVDVGWVKSHLNKPGIVLLDVSSNPNLFQRAHIPGAVFTHYKKDKWRVTGMKRGKKVAGLLPPVADLEKLVGRLGIGNDDHVVVVPAGFTALDMGTATRVYWTFKVLGHDNVSILNGGNLAYMMDKNNPRATGMSKPTPKTFKAKFNAKVLASEEDVRNAGKNGVALLDIRPRDQYLGLNKSGKVMTYGHVPGAVSVPGVWDTVNGGGMIRSKASLDKLYAYLKAPTKGPAITYCNTGHWASLGWFVNSEVMGNKDTKVYDGSMAEYTTDPNAPMDQPVNLN